MYHFMFGLRGASAVAVAPSAAKPENRRRRRSCASFFFFVLHKGCSSHLRISRSSISGSLK